VINVRELIGSHDVLFITLDTLRYDVAVSALDRGLTPNLARLLPGGQWERRHTPGSFTFAAHQAFFAGFLPTPAEPGHEKAPRLFAADFPGSETTSPETCVFDTPDIVSGLAARGYHTICIGGVGFFNRLTPLGCVLPDLFTESHWSPELGVTDPRSTENQVQRGLASLAEQPGDRRVFLFLNVSAIHQPNCFYAELLTRPSGTLSPRGRGDVPSPLGGEGGRRPDEGECAGTTPELPAEDSPETMARALAYVDSQLPPLFEAMRKRAPVLCVVCSDHGTAYGEDGYHGHRLSHSVVWDVPYAEFILGCS
jgi:hypothetical protein